MSDTALQRQSRTGWYFQGAEPRRQIVARTDSRRDRRSLRLPLRSTSGKHAIGEVVPDPFPFFWNDRLLPASH